MSPFATDAAPDGAEKLLAVNVFHGFAVGYMMAPLPWLKGSSRVLN